MSKTLVLNPGMVTRSKTRPAPIRVVEEVYVPVGVPVKSRSLTSFLNWNWVFNPSQWVCALLALFLLNLVL